jgi:hypothetical protein
MFARDLMVAVVAIHNLSESRTDRGNWFVHAEVQFCFNYRSARGEMSEGLSRVAVLTPITFTVGRS